MCAGEHRGWELWHHAHVDSHRRSFADADLDVAINAVEAHVEFAA